MNINLKSYQEQAVDKLVLQTKQLLAHDGPGEVCVFQAPTGSGKTIMTAKFIEVLIKELPDEDLCFLWISIGKGNLHIQSKHVLEKIFEGFPRVVLVEEEFGNSRDSMDRNEVVVANWEKLRTKDRATGDWKNVVMKDGEKLSLPEVLIKTREKRKIILIIDESQVSAATERAQEIRDLISADVVIEMSATPRLKPNIDQLTEGSAGFVKINPKEVIEEGMIKKELIINEGVDKIDTSESDSQEVVLEVAYQKRLQLKKAYGDEGSSVNPLVLIQIPTAEAGEDKIKAVREFLEKRHITEKNGKLAIWLAEQKSDTIDWISEPDNEIEFLIFKQAIDTGWDCPRAHILVKFREPGNVVFEIQTVGRILRMPEQRHYLNDVLNVGYIYTNLKSFDVHREEYNPNIIKHLRSKLIASYKPIKLTSYYKTRADYGDVTSSFGPVFEEVANKYFGIKSKHDIGSTNVSLVEKKGVKLDLKRYEQEIIADTKLEGKDFDDLEGKITPEALARLTIAGNDLQAMFEQAIKDNLGPFRGAKRSVPVIKTAIYSWFREYLGSPNWKEEILLIQKVFLHDQNRKVFDHVLAEAVDGYKAVKDEEVKRKVASSERYYDFELPIELFFNEHTDEHVKVEHYAFEPCYLNVDRSSPEKSFEKFLNENAGKIHWWWKNGENKQQYLGIKYENGSGFYTFYPDYIVQLQNGRIGIFEVKDVGDRDGSTITKAKAEALQAWLAQNKRKDIFGGIAIERNQAWLVNNKPKYDWEKYQKGDWSDWTELTTTF